MMKQTSKPDLGNSLVGYALTAVVAAALAWLFVMPAIMTAAGSLSHMAHSL